MDYVPCPDLIDPPKPPGTFAKIAQAVRRTIALEAHLSEGVGVQRTGLMAERASGRDWRGPDTTRRRPAPFGARWGTPSPTDLPTNPMSSSTS